MPIHQIYRASGRYSVCDQGPRLKVRDVMLLRLLKVLSVAVVAAALPTRTAEAVLFGASATGVAWEAVVSLSTGCTGTFIHPRFVITAAHCIRQCNAPSDTGCVTAPPGEVVRGNWTGRDGPPGSITATSGALAGQGDVFQFDLIYFPVPADLGRSNAPDVALLRSTTRFAGQVIPMLPSQDRPKPDESKYCPRYEYTWPTVVGFSPNSGVATMARRFGRAFAECDLELDQTLFKLDAHGRGVIGARICQGDSGGPVLWETGFGGFAVGGINSIGDVRNADDPIISNQVCMTAGSTDDRLRGESGHAFVPVAFLDRVAQSDAVCGGAASWDLCADGVVHYAGYQLRYLGTEIDQCGDRNLRIVGRVTVGRGNTASTEVPASRFSWTCGGSTEWTTAPAGTGLVVAKRARTDRQVIWDCYEVLGRSPPPLTRRAQVARLVPALMLMLD